MCGVSRWVCSQLKKCLKCKGFCLSGFTNGREKKLKIRKLFTFISLSVVAQK